jgi:uncharacterized protein (TIGR02453 family)
VPQTPAKIAEGNRTSACSRRPSTSAYFLEKEIANGLPSYNARLFAGAAATELSTGAPVSRSVKHCDRRQAPGERDMFNPAGSPSRDTLLFIMAIKLKPASTAAAHLRPEGLKFLKGLEKNNDREWFNQRKAVYEAELKEPMLAIIRKVTDAMMEFAPDHVRPAEKSLFRIYRDTRFSNNKLPYKTHVAAWWSHTGMDKTSGAGYYFQVSPKGVVIAAGAYMPEKDQLAAIRHWMLDNHLAFRKLLNRPAVKKTFSEFEGEALSRPPKGFQPDHPAMDLIKYKQWGLSTTLPAETALATNFSKTLTKHFMLLKPIVDALNEPIAASIPKKKVLFGLH